MSIRDPYPFATDDVALNERLKTLFDEAAKVIVGPKSARPSKPSAGTLYFDTDLKKLLVYNGSHWQDTMGAVV